MNTSIYCPYCHKYVELSNRGGFNSIHGEYWMGQCNSCQKVILVNNHSSEKYPMPLPEPIDSRILEPIRKDFEEANICFSASAFRAASVMARRAIQNICLDKGADEKDKLEKQIEWLFSQGIITKDLKDWAHEVRLVGNDAAHPRKPGTDTDINKSDAEDILELLKQFCQVLYVAPSIADERKKIRENK
ncbi:MAG: DUF4145 domain-containing protein [Candidatus Parcubacteria bacterium]|nr:DUF4145 domain-containing protein [Candidatus Parcubacteria bacterium]